MNRTISAPRRGLSIVFLLSLITIEVLVVLVHLAVYKAVAATFSIGGLVFATAFIILSLTFLSASLLTHWAKGKLVDWYYTAAAYWFGLVHYLFIGVALFFFVANVLYSENLYIDPVLLLGAALAALFLLHLYGTWRSSRPEVTSIAVTLPGLPDPWRGKKLVFVSDFHLGNIRNERFAAKVAEKINALAPEAVMIGGDLYDGTACDEKKLIAPLREIRAPRGVYFITGNHEYYLPDLPAAFAAIRDVGVRILDNEAADLGGITLVGVDDTDTHTESGFREVLQGLKRKGGAPTILLKHEPNHPAVARDAGIALMFAGHTHDGQIFPLNYAASALYGGFSYGMKRFGPMQGYVSSGVGTWGPPVRLGTKSEIVAITLS